MTKPLSERLWDVCKAVDIYTLKQELVDTVTEAAARLKELEDAPVESVVEFWNFDVDDFGYLIQMNSASRGKRYKLIEVRE